jgi:maleylpyruvate isomerase
MKLYSYWRSSAAYRVRIALNLKAIPYELLARDLTAGEHRTKEYLVTNPQGLVPALEHEGKVFTQSLAIIEYLDSVVEKPRMLPEEPLARADVAAMAQVIACEVHPLNNLRVTKYLRQEQDQKDDAVQAWYEHWMGSGFAALETLAGKHPAGHAYLYGDSVSLADVCLVPQMYNARRFNIDLDAYPILVSVDAHMQSLPAVIAASPERQADAG